jgi:molybdate transport system ATP-binding protein
MARLQETEAGSALLEVFIRKHYAASESSGFQLDTKFHAFPGITVLMGHSGAGKSTLLRCVAGLCHPEQGRIAIGPQVLFDAKQRINVETARRKVAFVFQDLALFPHLTVEENVAYGLRRLEAHERELRIREVLESFQIAALRKRLPRHISGGEQQRVALARSLVTRPSVLLLDEPLSSLDMRTKAGIVEDLQEWVDSHRIPVLYVTHNHEETLALGDHVITLEQGRIVGQGSPLEVISAPSPKLAARPDGYENLVDATVVDMENREGTIKCRLKGTEVELYLHGASVVPGETIQIGIHADEILIASTKPEMVSSCNLIRGRIKRVDHEGAGMEVRVDCGREFRARFEGDAAELTRLQAMAEVWLMIRLRSCHVLRKKARRGVLQQVFVFVCSHNTNRSPMAQAICNAEIARRLGIPMEQLAAMGIQVLSAGLSAQLGASMTAEAKKALAEIGVPAFDHKARSLDAGVVDRAAAILCMTEEQRQEALAMYPNAAAKIRRLDSEQDITDPAGKGTEVFSHVAASLRRTIVQQLQDWLVTPQFARFETQ